MNLSLYCSSFVLSIMPVLSQAQLLIASHQPKSFLFVSTDTIKSTFINFIIYFIMLQSSQTIAVLCCQTVCFGKILSSYAYGYGTYG